MNKIKVVWLCHFASAEIQALLPLRKKQDDFAFWIPNMLKGFENRDDFEIHIVSPQAYLNKPVDLMIRNIHYHFIPFSIPYLNLHWPDYFRFDVFTNFFFFRQKVKKTVNAIKPDIINLIGAENAYYSSAIFDFKEQIPVLVGIQGFICQFKEQENKNRLLIKLIETEEKILKEFTYFYGEQDSSTVISEYNPNHKFFKLYLSVSESETNTVPDRVKKYA